MYLLSWDNQQYFSKHKMENDGDFFTQSSLKSSQLEGSENVFIYLSPGQIQMTYSVEK